MAIPAVGGRKPVKGKTADTDALLDAPDGKSTCGSRVFPFLGLLLMIITTCLAYGAQSRDEWFRYKGHGTHLSWSDLVCVQNNSMCRHTIDAGIAGIYIVPFLMLIGLSLAIMCRSYKHWARVLYLPQVIVWTAIFFLQGAVIMTAHSAMKGSFNAHGTLATTDDFKINTPSYVTWAVSTVMSAIVWLGVVAIGPSGATIAP